MEAKELRIGNYIQYKPELCYGGTDIHIVKGITKHLFDGHPIISTDKGSGNIKVFQFIPLTEQWLIDFGFDSEENKMYINSKQFTLQVTGDRFEGKINRDETWFDGIGGYNFKETKQLHVNTLCRGNYVCSTVGHVHQLQNLFYCLTGKELTLESTKTTK